MKTGSVEIKWLGHSGFQITDLLENRVIYIDPFEINQSQAANIILLTHSHYDHCSINDINKISTPRTIVIAPPDCQSKLQGKVDLRDCVVLAPGKKISAGNIFIEAVPAYNTDKKFHPKSNEWIGFIVDINSKRIYHAGDTDIIPEMSSLKNIDIALLPVSGTYVMNAEEAAEAVKLFKPKLVIPMHYGSIVGEKSDAERFKALSDVPVEILEKE
jgi:L-ascorbate metabolism protein UlaG (beta-lactamase superfamily)